MTAKGLRGYTERMSLKPITQELYAKLTEAFRDQPANYANAARHAGCAHATARKGWNDGWPTTKKWARPIKLVLEEEKEAARALRYKMEHDAEQQEIDRRVQARADAIIARAQEAQGSKATRQNAINLTVVAARATMVSSKFVEEMERRIAVPNAIQGITAEEMRKWISMTSVISRRAEECLRAALEIERAVVGSPVGAVESKRENVTPQQMLKEFRDMERTLERLKKFSQTQGVPIEVPSVLTELPANAQQTTANGKTN